MNFRRSSGKRHKVRAALDLTPLVDVVFLLVLFFMLSSTFVTTSGIALQLPQAESATPQMGQPLVISLSAEPGGPGGEGRVVLTTASGEVEIEDWSALAATLTEHHDAQPDAAVTLRTDQRVPSGRLVEVLGLVTSAGIHNFNVAAEQPAERP